MISGRLGAALTGPWPVLALVVMASLVPTSARAQSVDPAAQAEPPGRVIRAVERGFFVQTDVGMAAFVNELDGRRYDPGLQVGVFTGYDVLSILSIGVGVSMLATELSVDDDTPDPRGDLFYVAPSARLQVAVFTTERDFVWVRGDFGYGFGEPRTLGGVDYAGNGPVFGISSGYERFSKLRHFAFGIHAGAFVVTTPQVGVAVTIAPTVKYTF